jgi:thymidylate synthase ThyX
MNEKRRVYLLDSKKLNPETIAVTFAKTSRSPQSFDQIAQELSDEKSAQFHERWVVGYGHASVAEHAVLHIAVENISRLAVECLESNRLAAYTEKSSRYQIWDADCFFIPDEIKGSMLENAYCDTVRTLFQKYTKALPILQSTIQNKYSAEKNALSEKDIHTHCMDVCRYYLPAAATANVGITINARSLEHALRKMLSHPLVEVRQVGQEIKQVAIRHLPTLIKYVDEVAYLTQAEERTTQLNATLPPLVQNENWCTLVDFDEQFETHILSALILRYGQASYAEMEKNLQSFSDEKKQTLMDILFGKLDAHDIPLRELEYSNFVFDLLMDQGAYFEFKRHRMMTQTVQPLSPYHGYAIPKLISESGLEADFIEAMDIAKKAYSKIAATLPSVASYVIPNAYNRRVLASFNLRTAIHFTALRTAPNAHFAIRRVANRMAEEIRSNMALFKPYFYAQPSETWQQIESDFFTDPIHF